MSPLPPGWVEVGLSEIAEVRLGRQRSPKNHSGTRMRPYLRAANVTWRGLDLGDVKLMNFTEAESADYELREGDLLLAEASGSASEVGKPALWRGELPECCFQNTLIRIRSRGADPSFLLHYFRAEARRGHLGDASKGVGIHHLGSQRLAAWKLPLPPLAEQRRIVGTIEEHLSHLDAADALLDVTERRLTALRTRSLAMALDGDWPHTTLGESADIVGGVTKDAKRQADPGLIEVPYLRVANVQRGFLDLSDVARIRVAPARAAALTLRPGDVLFNEGGDRDKLGRGWVWSGEIEGCIHQNHVFRARMHSGYDPKFVSMYANTLGRRWFEANGRQTTNLASLSLSMLKQFPVPALPIDEQRRIVAEVEERLSVVDATRAAIDAAQRRSARLRRAILERAFRGELVPQDPADEPASALLERIRAERATSPARPRRRPARGAGAKAPPDAGV